MRWGFRRRRVVDGHRFLKRYTHEWNIGGMRLAKGQSTEPDYGCLAMDEFSTRIISAVLCRRRLDVASVPQGQETCDGLISAGYDVRARPTESSEHLTGPGGNLT